MAAESRFFHWAESGERKAGPTGSLRTITSFFPVEDDEGTPTEDLKATLPDDGVPRGKRSRSSGRRKRKLAEAGEDRHGGQGPEYSVMSGWLHWYAQEEHEGEEDPEPLLNKRTQRRKKYKMLMLTRKFPEEEDDGNDGDDDQEGELRSNEAGRMIILEILDD